MKRIVISVLALAMFGMVSCNQEKTKELEERLGVLEKKMDNLSATQMINNPNTASTTENVPAGPLPAFKFEEMEHDFGTITQGQMVTHVFKFTNTGEGPLIIDNASASCGCTVPTWPKEPVQPGSSGEITVQFDSKGKVGQQSKQVSITANTQPSLTTLNIKANILDPAATSGPKKQ